MVPRTVLWSFCMGTTLFRHMFELDFPSFSNRTLQLYVAIIYCVLQRVLLNHSLIHKCRLEKRILSLTENQSTVLSFFDHWYIEEK